VERCMQSAAQPFFFQELCSVEKVLTAESIHSISCETDFRVNSMITDNGFVFAEISKGYIDKALGNDVAESGFHDPVCYCEFGKKPDDFLMPQYISTLNRGSKGWRCTRSFFKKIKRG